MRIEVHDGWLIMDLSGLLLMGGLIVLTLIGVGYVVSHMLKSPSDRIEHDLRTTGKWEDGDGNVWVRNEHGMLVREKENHLRFAKRTYRRRHWG